MVRKVVSKPGVVWLSILVACLSGPVSGQLIDKNKAPNLANEGIARPLMGGPYPSLIGNGRAGADWNTSSNIIKFDPFRAIRRGRQLFQRKFSGSEGLVACPRHLYSAFRAGHPAGCVAPPSDTPGILSRRALPSGRRAPKSTAQLTRTGH